MRYIMTLALLTACFFGTPASAGKLKVLACEPEWAALAHRLGGDLLDIDSATTFMQDPHHIQARPSLIAKARNADLVVCAGAELEVGWLPLLLRKSSNSRIQPGSAGYFMATNYVELVGQRGKVDRSEGDVHASGNPHVHFDPYRMQQIADALAVTLSQLMPEHQAVFEENAKGFNADLQTFLQQQAELIGQLRAKKVVVHHNSWPYFLSWLGMEKLAELEPKPGLPPSSSHLSAVLQQLEARPADAIVYASYQDDKPSKWLANRAGVAVVELPYSVENWQQKDALIKFYGELLTRLHSAIKSEP